LEGGTMKNWRHLAIGAALMVVGGLAYAAPITGPTAGSFPDFAAALNARFLNWFGFVSQGELQLVGGQSFVVNSDVATSLGSIGPAGSHTTVQRWLVVINPAGTVGYIPVF
jgi:hypothetical protein